MNKFVITTIALCALSSASFAQENTPLTADFAKTIKIDETTQAELIKTLGEPTRRNDESEQPMWAYVQDGKTLDLVFKDDKVGQFLFHQRADDEVGNMDYKSACDALNTSTTSDELTEIFSTPSLIRIDGKEETRHYIGNEQRVAIIIDRESENAIRDYRYQGEFQMTGAIDATALGKVKKGTSSTNDIRTLFGDPAQIQFTKEQEDWRYQNEEVDLQIRFDRSTGTVSRLTYRTR